MKILNILASLAPRYGGPSKSCPELAQALARRGHQVTIYTTNWDGDQELPLPERNPQIDKGVEVFYFPVQFPRFWAFSAPMIRAIRDNLHKFDIVHVYSLYFSYGWITRRYCLKYGIPFVLQPHGSLDPFLYRHHRFRKIIADLLYENKNIRSASAILYNAEEEKRIALGAVRGRPSGIVPLGLNLSDYTPEPARGQFRSRHPETAGKKIILFLSRVNFKKGLDLLVKTFAQLSRRRSDIHLVISGPDNEGYGREILALCKREGIADHVTMTGMLSELEKRQAFMDADLFALTSYTENFGVTILEAMACGVPVVISDKVNIWREIHKADAGKVVPCRVPEIAECLQALLDDPAERARLSDNGRRLVHEQFQWDRAAEQQEVFFETVLKASAALS